jgi:diguanylate cyclase (GGDEF)-like protein/PAS domain S-box-containing protein
MEDRIELLEAALDCLPEGFAFADLEGQVRFWNRAAKEITGHPNIHVVGRSVRETVEDLIVGGVRHWVHQTDAETPPPGRGSLVRVRHSLGHDLPILVRVLALRDGLGGRIGTAVIFHPSENLDALPRGDCGENSALETSQTELQERLEAEHDDFSRGNIPLGVMWITVDQAHGLRQTHGTRACEAMVEKVERTLMHGLRPAEQIGRWGEDEFLVISHERTAETLAAHGQVLAGFSRTTDFRWWGDRISLTVSIGAAQADQGEPLTQLLARAQAAMLASVHAGGNHISLAPGRHSCSPL